LGNLITLGGKASREVIQRALQLQVAQPPPLRQPVEGADRRVQLEVELVGVIAVRSRLRGGTQLVDDVEVSLQPAVRLFALENVQVQLELQLDWILRHVPAEIVRRITGERVAGALAERRPDRLRRQANARDGRRDTQCQNELELHLGFE